MAINSVLVYNEDMSITKLYTRTCTQCNMSFQSGNRKAKICSEECRKAMYRTMGLKQHKRVERTCNYCGCAFIVRTCRPGKYCSRLCGNKAKAKANIGAVRTSRWEPCNYCGKAVKRYKSRTHRRAFCNEGCYHAWDSWYKSQPEQQRKHAERALKSLQAGTSKVEDAVAEWLDRHGISYERQVAVVRYSMDFRVGNAFVEVQGCYWHGCPHCYTLLTPKQQKRLSRDKAKYTYCRKRDIPLFYIWEHDVRKGDFSALMPLVVA